VLTILLLLAIGINVFPIRYVQADGGVTDWNYVDILCIGDEELMAHQDWIENCESHLAQVNEGFVDSEIKLFNRGWQDWDSNDAENDVIDLYFEAIEECGLPIEWIEVDPDGVPGAYNWGFVSGSEWIDSYGDMWLIDLLLIFVGQGMDGIGLSLARCNAVIIDYSDLSFRVLLHELGHQYFLRHCSHLCVMHDLPTWDNFCSDCENELMNQRDKWVTDCHDLTTSKTGNGVIDISDSPTGHEESSWLWKEDAYDDDQYTPAGSGWIQLDQWSDWLILTHEEIDYVNNIRWCWTYYNDMEGRRIILDIDVYNGDWHDVHQMEYTESHWCWYECTFDPISGVTKVRFRCMATNAGESNFVHMFEVDFNGWSSEEGTTTFLHNTLIDVKAIPDEECIFDYWILDGTPDYSNPVTITMNTDHSLEAYFKTTYTLTIQTTTGGTTDPSPGPYVHDEGTPVTVYPDPNDNYEFNYWKLDGQPKYDNPYTVTMNSDHTLTAYFSYVGGGGTDPCPILHVYDGENYIDEGALNIHNPEGFDVIHRHILTTDPEPVNNKVLLRLVEHPLTHSYIDSVDLYMIDENDYLTELPLIKAVHSEYGNVLPELMSSDDERTDADGNESIDLQFQLNPNITAKAFIFVVEGYNPEFK
jgi:hypothetical protein